MTSERVKRAGTVGAIGVVLLLVVVGMLFVAGVLGVPNAGLADNNWGDVDDDRIEVVTDVWIDNPNPFGGGDADVEYEIALQDIRLAEGSGEGIGVPTGNQTHEFRTDLLYDRLPAWWVAHLNNDEVSSVAVDATADVSVGPLSGSPSGTYEDSVDTDIEGALDRGFSEFEGTYSGTETELRAPDGTPIDPTVEVESVSTEWGNVTEDNTEILVTADIHNPNPYPIPTPAFTGYVDMNEVRVAEWSASEVSVLDVTDEGLIESEETEQRTFRIVMDNQNVPAWFATHVDRGEQTDVAVAGMLALEVGDSEVTIPQESDGVSCEFDLRTAIFVDDQDTQMQFEECGTAPLSIAQDQLEAVGASLDITETDWWLDLADVVGGDD